MADHVIVNGVSLTREQVEKAWKELNPPPLTWRDFPGGTRVKGYGSEGVVVCGNTRDALRKAYPSVDRENKNVWWVILDTGVTMQSPPESLTKL